MSYVLRYDSFIVIFGLVQPLITIHCMWKEQREHSNKHLLLLSHNWGLRFELIWGWVNDEQFLYISCLYIECNCTFNRLNIMLCVFAHQWVTERSVDGKLKCSCQMFSLLILVSQLCKQSWLISTCFLQPLKQSTFLWSVCDIWLKEHVLEYNSMFLFNYHIYFLFKSH